MTDHMNEGLQLRGRESNKLLVFDLDDTLIISDAKIHVKNSKGRVIKKLTPARFNDFIEKDHHVMDFQEFQDFEILRRSKFTKLMEKFKSLYKRNYHIAILTARSKTDMIRDFFLSMGIDIHPQLVIATDDPRHQLTGTIQERKKKAFEIFISLGYSKFMFFDDNLANLKTAKELEKTHDVTIKTIHV